MRPKAAGIPTFQGLGAGVATKRARSSAGEVLVFAAPRASLNGQSEGGSCIRSRHRPERFMKEANRRFRLAWQFRRCGGKSDGFIQYLALDRGRGPVSAAVRRPRKDFG